MSSELVVAPLPSLLSRTGDNRTLILDLIDIFDDESDHMLAELRRSVEVNDGAAVYAAAHRLRGSLRIFAASHAVHVVEQLESMGRAGALHEAPSRLEELIDELSRVRTTLHAYRNQLASLEQHPSQTV